MASLPLSRLLADLLGASVGIWSVWNVLRLQHKLHGAARILRWTIVVVGLAVFLVADRQWLSLDWRLKPAGVLSAALFFVFPDISFYLVMGTRKLRTGWTNKQKTQSR